MLINILKNRFKLKNNTEEQKKKGWKTIGFSILVFWIWVFFYISTEFFFNFRLYKMGFYYVLTWRTFVVAGGDPHFMIRIRGMEYPLCFDLHANPGDVLRILADQESGTHTNLKSFHFQLSIVLSHHILYIPACTYLPSSPCVNYKTWYRLRL